MPSSQVAAVMIHVDDAKRGLAWYETAFPEAKRERSVEDNFEYLRLGSLQIEVVEADEKVASGACGSVVYWQVRSVAEAVSRFQSLGATLYRGPMRIEGGLSMCQVRDPWGNCIGLRGPA